LDPRYTEYRKLAPVTGIASDAKVAQNASPGCKFLGELFSYFIIGEFFTAACIYLIQGFPSFLNNAAENQTTIPVFFYHFS
jgi:hypothetical protein